MVKEDEAQWVIKYYTYIYILTLALKFDPSTEESENNGKM